MSLKAGKERLVGDNPEETLTMDTSKSVTAVFSRKVYFVSDLDGLDTNAGLSWGQAFKTLQKALDMAAMNPDYQIWVATGAYYPSEEQIPGDARSASFCVSRRRRNLRRLCR